MKKQIGLFSKEELKSAPRKPGVYFVFTNKYFTRLKGRTNIVYIGKGTNLYQRLIGPRKALARFNALRDSDYILTFNYKILRTKLKKKKLKKLLRKREIKELKKFEKQHLELPSLNHSN